MNLKNIAEKIFEGTKIIGTHYLSKKDINEESILCLQPEDFPDGSLKISDNTKFIKDSTYQKYYSNNPINNCKLYYNDFLYNTTNSQLYIIQEDYDFIKKDFKYTILPSEKFLIIRPYGYLMNFLNNSSVATI
ncbi:MAG: hypothetical protein HY738_05195 [Bacteroidia bacterium]|nr:hypothetical protein [Bacteroidia bacterium]